MRLRRQRHHARGSWRSGSAAASAVMAASLAAVALAAPAPHAPSPAAEPGDFVILIKDSTWIVPPIYQPS